MFDVLGKIIKYGRITNNYPSRPLDKSLGLGRPVIRAELCDGCGFCVEACPSEAISVVNGKAAISLDKCIFCGMCQEVCEEDKGEAAVFMSHEIELGTRNKKELFCVAEGCGTAEMSDGCGKADVASGCGLTDMAKDGLLAPEGLEEQKMASQEELEEKLSKKIKKIYGRSLQIREVDAGSCNGCDYEINATCNPLNDIEKLGIHFVASPRHADMLLVTGPVSRNMEEALIKTYQATPSPKLVVAVGACACSGGIFRDSYAVQNGVDKVLPVDAYIPGCPPRPAAIIHGILKALETIEK